MEDVQSTAPPPSGGSVPSSLSSVNANNNKVSNIEVPLNTALGGSAANKATASGSASLIKKRLLLPSNLLYSG